MKIGIVGSEGIVGSAVVFGMRKLGHEVKCHDLSLDTKIKDLIGCEIIFICVPTPSNEDGSCDTFIVESVIGEFDDALGHAVSPIIAIKSTVPIGTTKKIQLLFPELRICFVPEFLKERSAVIDFTERHEFCIIGTKNETIYNKVKEAHGNLPDRFIHLFESEAEASKYFWNSFNAMRVVFANSFYEICKKYDVDYNNVKNSITQTSHLPSDYLTCNDNWRGYAGACLLKDVPALDKMSEGTIVEFFRHIIEENEKYIKTVPLGMRLK